MQTQSDTYHVETLIFEKQFLPSYENNCFCLIPIQIQIYISAQ